MNAHPDFIAVETSRSARVEANRADISVTVAGASLFSGAVALQKAREVAELVAALKAIGIEEMNVKVEGVRAQNASGTFSKTSSVSYELRVENVPLERVADAVGAITSAKNSVLENIQWKFPDETPLRDELRAKCLADALERIKSISQILGVRIVGIYELKEHWRGTLDQISHRNRSIAGSGELRAKRVSTEELGLEISHAESVHLQLDIQFRVSEFGN